MLYKEYRDEIPQNTLKTWSSTLMEGAHWQHIGWTGNPKEPLRHWAAYPPMEGMVKQIWDFLNESLIEDGFSLRPDRVILNLYNHGDSSWLHKDSENENDWTVILFLNEYWALNWGGDFALADGKEIIQAFSPTPGKFICFRANTPHGARPVSREAPYPRFGIAFQCKVDDSNIQGLSQPKISPIRTAL